MNNKKTIIVGTYMKIMKIINKIHTIYTTINFHFHNFYIPIIFVFIKYFLDKTSIMNGHLKSKHKNTVLTSNKDKPKNPGSLEIQDS